MTSETPELVIPLNRSGNRRGMHPNAQKALADNRGPTQIKPGESLNPAGLSITSRAKLMLGEVCPFDKQGRTWQEAEAEALLRHGLVKTDGMGELLDRTEGKVPQKVQGDINGKLEVIVRWDGNRNIPGGASPPSASQTG